MSAPSELQWERVVEAVRRRCVGPAAALGPIPVAESRAGARLALRETQEAIELAAAGEPLPLDGLRDVRGHLARVERGGVLEGPALRDVASSLRAALALGRFLGRHRGRAPSLFRACAVDPTLETLAGEIEHAVDADGTLSDHASPELRRLRTESANLRGRLVARLEQMIVERAELLSDRFYTLREGRYVLPVRADAHERVSGIVHGTSASGATVFVEPRQLIEQGNRLKMAEAELEREVARLLALLSERVAEEAAGTRAAADALDHADLKAASARLARDLDGVVLTLVDEPRIALRRAKHPVLLLDGVDVVANDVAVEAGQGLVFSGPNAGGKTVALKLLGLSALMTRAGLAFPALEGSECGFFDDVLCDIGDGQSIETNLSTFSAHVTNLAAMLRRSRRGVLVLLDEVATGTDPEEGAALACALVDAFCRRGAALAVTTHYEALKALALTDDRLRNASVGFDFERLAPTFELALDVPGASSALAVAGRFGLPEDLLATARRMLPEGAMAFDDVVRRLDEQRRAVEIERRRLEDETLSLVATREALAAQLATGRERDRARVSKEAERLLAAVRRAREDLREAKRAMRAATPDVAMLAGAARQVEEVARVALEVREELAVDPAPPRGVGGPVPEDALRVGMRVFVPRLRAEAEILETPRGGRVRVAAGALKLVVETPGLLGVLPATAASGGHAGLAAKDGIVKEARAAPRRRERTPDNTIDLRGLRVDEALAMAEAFLDRLYGDAAPFAFLLHGAGTGALREALREHLSAHQSYVLALGPASRDEGGDGVTVVELR